MSVIGNPLRKLFFFTVVSVIVIFLFIFDRETTYLEKSAVGALSPFERLDFLINVSPLIEVDCRFYNAETMELEVALPGGPLCLIIHGQGVVMGNEKGISLYSFEGELVWSRDYIVHHDISFDKLRNVIYFTSADESNGKVVHVVKGINMKGEEVFNWDPMSYIQESEYEKQVGFAKKHGLVDIYKWQANHYDTKAFINQVTVVNDVVLKGTESGDIIIGFWNFPFALILDPLAKVVKNTFYIYKEGEGLGSHTIVPFDRNSFYVIQNNYLFDGGSKKRSRYLRMNLDGDILWEYPQNNTEEFWSPLFGSIDLISENKFLVTDVSRGGRIRIIDKEGRNYLEWYKDPEGPKEEFTYYVRKANYLNVSRHD